MDEREDFEKTLDEWLKDEDFKRGFEILEKEDKFLDASTKLEHMYNRFGLIIQKELERDSRCSFNDVGKSLLGLLGVKEFNWGVAFKINNIIDDVENKKFIISVLDEWTNDERIIDWYINEHH